MPKLLVLVDSGDDDVAALALAAAHAASHVRFMEVDVRSTHDRDGMQTAAADDMLIMYDGILVAADATLSASATALLRRRAGSQPTTNAVFAVLGGLGALSEVATLGGILATATGAGKPQAEALGAKVAKVTGWVRHALGHEGEDAGHSHATDHHHDRGEHAQ